MYWRFFQSVTERALAFFLKTACVPLFGCTIFYLSSLLLIGICLWYIAIAYNAAMNNLHMVRGSIVAKSMGDWRRPAVFYFSHLVFTRYFMSKNMKYLVNRSKNRECYFCLRVIMKLTWANIYKGLEHWLAHSENSIIISYFNISCHTQ